MSPGDDMSDFEGLFALLSLMFGLIVAELAIKSADAIDSHAERPVGILTPALTFLVLTDVTSFWLWVWGARKVLEINWPTVFGGVLMAFVYFLAASLVFPRVRFRAFPGAGHPVRNAARPERSGVDRSGGPSGVGRAARA